MTKQKVSNLDWLIAARGFGMYAVFTIHLMGVYVYEQHIDHYQQAIAYSEPVVLSFFAILTGAFFTKGNSSFLDYFRLKFTQRMLPVYLYFLLVIPFFLLFPPEGQQVIQSLKYTPLYLVGIPILSWSSWFLIAMFSCEIIYYFIIPYAKGIIKTLILALICFTIVWTYQHYVSQMPIIIAMVGMAWMFQAALLFCFFYLLGSILKPYIIKFSELPVFLILLIAVISMALTYLGVSSNTYFRPGEDAPAFLKLIRAPNRIDFSTGQYGNYFWFILSTLAGSLAFISVCRLIPVTRFMRACGDYSLVLLGLCGVFQTVLNHYIAAFFIPPKESIFLIFLYPMLLGLISMAISLPIAMQLSKFLPQLTGRPMLNGPILPPLYKKRVKS